MQRNNTYPEKGLYLKNLKIAYSKNPLLQIPNLLFPRGKVIGITGSNGIGKSSLAAVLTGLKKPSLGRISLDGNTLHTKQLTREAYLVMQDVNRQLFTDSALAEVRLGTNLTDEEAQIILNDFDLSEKTRNHPLSLSGGQKQRLTVAGAKALNRNIYVFDEPSSGLDLGHLEGITQTLRNLAASEKIVILITHDPELMNSAADYRLDIDKFSVSVNKKL